MVLEYLPALASGLQLAGGISGLQNTLRGPQVTAAEKASLQALSNQNRLIQAMLNPKDIINRNLVDSETKSLREITQRGLTDLLNADRRSRLMGRTTYFNPERRDESINKYLTNTAMQIEPLAQKNALSRIMDAITNYRSLGSSYSSLVAPQAARDSIMANRNSMALTQGADLLRSFNPNDFQGLTNLFSSLGGSFA